MQSYRDMDDMGLGGAEFPDGGQIQSEMLLNLIYSPLESVANHHYQAPRFQLYF